MSAPTPTLHTQFQVTVSNDDHESFETDTMLLTVQIRIPKTFDEQELEQALTGLGQRILDASAARFTDGQR